MLNYSFPLQYNVPRFWLTNRTTFPKYNGKFNRSIIVCCSEFTATSPTESQAASTVAPPVIRRRRRYRKQYPGERIGITEEMRFVAMKLRETSKVKPRTRTYPGISNLGESESENESENLDDVESLSCSDGEESVSDGNGGEKETWEPSTEGFVKYLVDSKLVFDFVERIVDESSDVSYAYFRRTGLERSEALSKDLEWFSQQDIVVPEPSTPGVTYVKYLEELAESCPSLFLCHFYNIYFSHIAGGQVIAKQVSEKIFESKQLEFYSWEGEPEELLRGVREKLNMLGEHWSRDEKNKCLREATKSFRFLGDDVKLRVRTTPNPLHKWIWY